LSAIEEDANTDSSQKARILQWRIMRTIAGIPWHKNGDAFHTNQNIPATCRIKTIGDKMQTNEQVVVIQGDPTKWYSQVVFILNPNQTADKTPIDFVAEAEKIIFNYVEKKRKYTGDSIQAYLNYTPPIIIPAKKITPPFKERKRLKPSFLLYILMAAACVALAAIVGFGLIS